MNIRLSIVFLWLYSISYSQDWINLVPNYSFEVVTPQYPNNGGATDYMCYPPYSDIEDYWGAIYEWTHPLKKHFLCGISDPAVGTANVIRDTPPLNTSRSGVNRGKTTGHEFLVAPLWNGGIKSDKVYYYEVFKKGSSSSKMYFSQGQPRQCGYNPLNSPSNGLLSGSRMIQGAINQDWTRTRGYLSSTVDYSWVILGDNDNGGVWDDLRIYEVNNNKCRDNWYFDNTVFNYPVEVFQASKNIYVGNGVDPENGVNHIPGDVIQYANTKVILRAGNQVIIDQGTFANNAGPENLIIENSPCGDNLCPDELEFENEVLCNQSSAVIGTEGNDWGTSVQWSPSTYLSDPNVANPTFTSPGGVGSITYEVEITYECDASEVFPNPDQPLSFSNSYTEIHEVVVQYTNSSDPSASITANVLQDDVYNFETDLTFSEGVTEIEIEVVSSSGPGFSQTYYLGEDFSCCNYNWELPNAWRWSSCDDDIIKITARNKCSGEESVIELPWDKSQIPFTGPSSYANVVTANNDGVNDQLCFNDIESADNYTIYILNRWGNTIYFEINEDVTDSRICIDASLENYTEGTYFYLVSFTDECGNSVVHDQDFFLVTSQKSNSSSGGRGEDVEHHTIREYLEENISISPNPTSSILNISGPSGISSVEIVDKTGRQIIKTEVKNSQVNVQNLESGTYYCKFSLNDIIIIKKFVKI